MRAAFSMTIDPDGAMHDWVDAPAGWSLLRIPTQEAVHLVGPRLYQELLVEVCARERPALLVTHPPYDWLDADGARRIRETGTRLVAYAFDDEIFGDAYDARPLYDRYVTTREVRWATRPLDAVPTRPPEFDVVLVGRAYERRRILVERMRAAGLNVVTRGVGWSEGFISRAEMIELYSRAAIVLTTADWESRAVPMVKHRLLDTAMLGCFQIAQAAPDLRSYFSEEEVPSFADADQLIAHAKAALADQKQRRERANAARHRALAEHTWQKRWPELIGGLALTDQPMRERSRFFDGILAALASRAEADGRVAAADALFSELSARDPDAAAAGLGRCLRDLGRHEEALTWLQRAAAQPQPLCAGSIDARLPAFGVGTGLGRLGLLPPTAEPVILQIATLVELGRIDEAVRVLEKLDGALARAVAGSLSFGDRAELEPLRLALARLTT